MLVILLSSLAIVASLPALVLGCECLMALLPLRREQRAQRGERPSVAVVVPAHNEQAGIAQTIDAIVPQLGPDDRLIVVADNCNDDTAGIARSRGATVTERFDAERRGKGYAVRFALEHLRDNPPEVIICIDADCQPQEGCLEQLARVAYATGNPIQAAYHMLPPAQASPSTLISAFAVLVKNYIRPRGLQRMKMPCLITGSGVAYPWTLLQRVPHPKSHIVEDMHYSVDLALAGAPPLPCMEAVVESQLPDAQSAARTQRTRWEHGHLSVIKSQGPRLLLGALQERSLRLLAMWLELMVPPLSLLIFALSAIAIAIAIGSFAVGSWLPLELFFVPATVGILGLTTAWWRFGRRVLPTSMLFRVPHYVLGKLSIYKKFLAAPEQAWVRTARESPSSIGDSSLKGPHFDTSPAPAKNRISAD